ncbi:MAG: AsmA family protein, partial [Nitrospinae bacterium]|nr:AsmA family protein [Nitrospinota bacterium]
MKVSKKKKIVIYFLGSLFIVFLAVVNFVYVQLSDLDNLKGMAVEKLEDLTGRRVSIGAAEIDFGKGVSVRLRNIFVGSPDGPNRQFSARSAWVVVKLWPLLNQRIEVQKLIVEGASFQLTRNAQGRLNIGDLSRLFTEPTASRLFKVLSISFMHQLSILDGEVRFLDYYNTPGPDPLVITVKNISLSVNKQFLQKPFSFRLSGEIPNAHRPTAFSLSGTFDPPGGDNGIQPIPIQGKIKVDQLHVPQFRPYFKKVLSAAPADSWLSLESDFSGSLGGALRSEGKLRYSTIDEGRQAVLRSMDSPNRGVMDYSIVLNKDSIEFQNINLRSGSMNFSAHGRLANLSSSDPSISFAIQTGEFQIRNTRQYLPLIFFPDSVHRDLARRFQNGTMEIKSLTFDGSLKQLQDLSSEENRNLLAADIVLRQVDWRSPLPPLKKVTGSLKYKNGDGTFKIVKARYKGLSIANIKGTVRSMMNNPVADLSAENRVELEKLNRVLKSAIAGESFKNILDDYQDFSGKGLLKVKVMGPLEEPDKISITATLLMENASFYEAEMKTRIKNFKGEIQYHHVPEKKQERASSPVPIIRFKDLSGEFGKSAFHDMQGKIVRKGGNIVRDMTAKYRLNAEELPGIIADIDFEGPLFSILRQAEFSEGDVMVDYKNFMDFSRPEEEKDWGDIELKNVSVKHPTGFQPLLKLTGGISFGDGQIRLKKIAGRYGNSPIQLDGWLTPKSGALLDFNVQVTSTDWTQPDFKDIPYLKNLEFSGPVRADFSLTGNRRSFKFKSKIDLTRAGYGFREAVHKKENVPNQMNMRGTYSEKKGIASFPRKRTISKTIKILV